jgi:hypothetical protein
VDWTWSTLASVYKDGNTPHTGAHSVPSQSQRGTTHPSHGHPHPTEGHTHCFISVSERKDTPNSWASSPQTGAYTWFHLSLREEHHTHLMGIPNSWALSQVVSLSLRGERVLEDVSRSCNHQYSLSTREAFSTKPSLSRKYSNFILASGLVKISAICSCVGRYCMCTAFLCTMSLI